MDFQPAVSITSAAWLDDKDNNNNTTVSLRIHLHKDYIGFFSRRTEDQTSASSVYRGFTGLLKQMASSCPRSLGTG